LRRPAAECGGSAFASAYNIGATNEPAVRPRWKKIVGHAYPNSAAVVFHEPLAPKIQRKKIFFPNSCGNYWKDQRQAAKKKKKKKTKIKIISRIHALSWGGVTHRGE